VSRRDLGRSPWLLGIGGAVSAVVLAVVGWGQLRDVDVPRPLGWDHTPLTVCAGAGVDTAALGEAIGAWRDHGHPVVPSSAPACDVEVLVDEQLDARDSVDDDRFVHGRASIRHTGGLIESAELRVVDGADVLVLEHELGHALGYAHPIGAPTGHLLHPSRPGLRDWRGLDAGTAP
jgi:hypothetical protein